MKFWNKLNSRRGETLTETLVGILIVGLSSVVLAAMVTAASNMNATAIAGDKALYAAVTAAEKGTQIGSQEVTVEVTVGTSSTPFVSKLCGDENVPLYAYRYEEGTP